MKLPHLQTHTGAITLLQVTDLVYLSALSPKDFRWDDKRDQADKFKALYQTTEFNCYAVRIENCSRNLVFRILLDNTDDTGLCQLKLQAAKFCRCRQCPICQDRRSLMWKGKAFKILPRLLHDYPKARFLFLTLTVRNCELSNLRSTLEWMHKSWHKLIKRKEFISVDGWIRSVEITRSQDDTAHPHYHCLLMVKHTYFSGNYYISQERWSEIWRDCLGVTYNPIVDIRIVKPKKEIAAIDQRQTAVISALVELIKYTTKSSDVLRSNSLTLVATSLSNQQWLIELTKQLHKSRAIATGGIFKSYLKVLEEDPEDLIHVDQSELDENNSEFQKVTFGWREEIKRYVMESKA